MPPKEKIKPSSQDTKGAGEATGSEIIELGKRRKKAVESLKTPLSSPSADKPANSNEPPTATKQEPSEESDAEYLIKQSEAYTKSLGNKTKQEETPEEHLVSNLESYDSSLKRISKGGEERGLPQTNPAEAKQAPQTEEKVSAYLEEEKTLSEKRANLAKLERELSKREKENSRWSRVKQALKGDIAGNPELANFRKAKEEAEREYYDAQIYLSRKMLSTEESKLRSGNFSEQEIIEKLADYKAGAVLTRTILDEGDLLEAEIQNLEPKKERGLLRRGWDWYAGQNKHVKAVGTAVALGGVAAATAGIGFAAYYFGRRLTGAYGAIGGALMGVAWAKAYEKKRERKGEVVFGEEEKQLRERIRSGKELNVIELANGRILAKNKKEFKRKTEIGKKARIIGTAGVLGVTAGASAAQTIEAIDHAANLGIKSTPASAGESESALHQSRGLSETFRNTGADPDEFRAETEEIGRAKNLGTQPDEYEKETYRFNEEAKSMKSTGTPPDEYESDTRRFNEEMGGAKGVGAPPDEYEARTREFNKEMKTAKGAGTPPDEYESDTRRFNEEMKGQKNTTPDEFKEPIFHKVSKGETNLDKVLINEMKARGLDRMIPEGKVAQTNFVENLKRYYAGMSPEDLKRHIPSGDLGKIRPGDQIGLPMFNDSAFLDKNIARANGLTEAQIKDIENYSKPKMSGGEALKAAVEKDYESGKDNLGSREVSQNTLEATPAQVAKVQETFLKNQFPGIKYFPWMGSGEKSFIWTESKNLNASKVLSFQGEYGGTRGADGGADYGNIGETKLPSSSFEKLKGMLADLQRETGVTPDPRDSVEDFVEKAIKARISKGNLAA